MGFPDGINHFTELVGRVLEDIVARSQSERFDDIEWLIVCRQEEEDDPQFRTSRRSDGPH